MRHDNDFVIMYFRVALFSLAIGIAAIDLYLLGRYGTEATISNLLRKINDKWLLLSYFTAFGMGALFYHLFGPR